MKKIVAILLNENYSMEFSLIWKGVYQHFLLRNLRFQLRTPSFGPYGYQGITEDFKRPRI